MIHFPKAYFNAPKLQKFIGEVSGGFTHMSLSGIHLIPISDSFFAKEATVDLDLWLEALSMWSLTLSISFLYKPGIFSSKIGSKIFYW